MNKKRILIAIICIALAVLLICSLFVAAGFAFANADDSQFGGLVGELLAGKENQPSLFPDQTQDETITQELATEEQVKLPYAPIFYYDAADIQDALMMGELQEDGAYLSLTVDNTWKDYQASLIPMDSSYAGVTCIVIVHRTNHVKTQGSFGIAARAESNDVRHVIFTYFTREDYSRAVWRSSLVEIGGLFQDNPHNYISYLSYEPFVNEQNGQTVDVAFIAGFASREDAEMYLQQTESPAALADASHLQHMLENQPSKGIKKFRYYPASDLNGDYVQITCENDAMSTGFTVIPYTSEVFSTGARYLVIKLNYDTAGGYVIASSSTPENGTTYSFHFQQDGWWNLLVIDLARIEGINESYDLSYLYLCFYDNTSKSYPPITIPWIGTFQSIYAAQKYDEQHPYSKG